MISYRPSELTLKIAAFAAVYVIWGSTYLAIQFVVETLPGLSMVGLRFLIAGGVLYAWARFRGESRPTAENWRAVAVSGALLLVGGTGGVVLAVEHLDSGLVALLVGTEPLWLALLMAVWPGGKRPSVLTFGALLVGFAGAAILAAPSPGGTVHLPSVAIILAACVSWGAGSLYSRTAPLPSSPTMTSALQMTAGGVLMSLAGVLRGEWASFEPAAVSAVSVASFLYLTVFGSIVAFSAFSWLIRTTEPTLVATHTYVNPVVAVFLGWLLADESVGPRTLVGAALILGSVVLVTTANARGRRRLRAAEPVPAAAAACRAAKDAPADCCA